MNSTQRSVAQDQAMSQASEQIATNLYYDRTFDCEAAKILPGEYFSPART
jgi:hypothetical protein